MNGVLIVDKPPGLTSHDVVNRVRRILHQPSVGHLGTLDPLATGLLPLVTGNLTRLAQFYTSSEKTYEGVIRFGFATDTYDSEGEPSGPTQAVNVTLEQMRGLAARFVGRTDQMPPPFSAKKINGVPAYKLARKHKDVPLKAVQVEIKEFEILGLEGAGLDGEGSEGKGSKDGVSERNGLQGDRASFRARVASGTYMRSVAHDMGQQIGCGAHLASLRRTALGEFSLSDAHTLEELTAVSQNGQSGEISKELAAMFVHPRRLLPQFPCVTANDEVVGHIRSGRAVNLPDFSEARQVKVFAGQRELIAIATRIAGTLFHPKIVLVGSPATQPGNGNRA
jgi:tRNA pseudouridine55 synthase